MIEGYPLYCKSILLNHVLYYNYIAIEEAFEALI